VQREKELEYEKKRVRRAHSLPVKQRRRHKLEQKENI